MIGVLFDGSSSEFSEDYTPLAACLNSQGTYQLNDTGKQLPLPILPKKPGFVIPQKKKQANGIRELVVRFYTCTRGRVYTLTESNPSPSQNAESPIKSDKMAISEENTVNKNLKNRKLKSSVNGRGSTKYFKKIAMETWINGIVLSLA